MKSALTELTSIAEAAAATARNATPKLVEQKSVQDFVTDMDRDLQSAISAALKRMFPDVPSFGEEDIAAELGDHFMELRVRLKQLARIYGGYVGMRLQIEVLKTRSLQGGRIVAKGAEQ